MHAGGQLDYQTDKVAWREGLRGPPDYYRPVWSPTGTTVWTTDCLFPRIRETKCVRDVMSLCACEEHTFY